MPWKAPSRIQLIATAACASALPARRFLAWFTVSANKLKLTQGETKNFRSSTKGRRDFCAECGTQLFFQGEDSKLIDITTASLDDPDQVPPQFHIWRTSRVEWFDTSDGLPWHDERGPDGAA